MAVLSRGIRPSRWRPGDGVASRAAANLGAQGLALGAVSVASLMVARAGGPAVVGEYALLRVLPWLFAVVLSAGLPTASAYFLAGEESGGSRLRPTLAWLAGAGAAVGALVWLACAGLIRGLFFKQSPVGLVAAMAVVVVTQLLTVTSKACCQGSGDLTGANLVIVTEELYFVGCYPALLLVRGNEGVTTVVEALLLSGGLATATGLLRLRHLGFFAGWGPPSAVLARRIVVFGARGQLGNMLWLMNLRFDFLLLGALAGPAELGIYAVASKFAELMRLVPTAMNYVLYPRFTGLGLARATAEARRLLPRATALTLAMTPFMAVIAAVALPLLYGAQFRAAVAPAVVIILGLSVEGAAAVSSAFLLGGGRPGLNSMGMGVGTAITVALDVVLIPRYGAMGGAVTSALAYVATTVTLTLLAARVARPPSDAEAVPRDSLVRRAVDLAVASLAVLVVSPLLLVVAAAVRTTSRGPVLFRQVRVGRFGRPFTMLKFRSMVVGGGAGPLITARTDPRVTRVGAVIRATKLDELPQLLNVLAGHMTLIGPRPEVPRFIQCYRPEELAVLNVRPGLTGAGQVYAGEVQATQAVEATDAEAYYEEYELHPKLGVDLDYLRRRSLSADLAIVARTVALILRVPRGGSPGGSPAHGDV
jgi:lipopolysaccharide/colanic/teichoic acid biosynthesis glycosyltransferase